MRIRRVARGDVPQIARLYYETVHRVNARDYGPEQIRAWAPQVSPDAWWQRRFQRYRVLVAEECGAVVGFVELSRNGEVDCFYVHHRHQHRGIGAALMARVEREARSRGNDRLTADVSITAEPFFRRMGFRIVRRQVKIYRNRSFKQALMDKRLRRVEKRRVDTSRRPPAMQGIGLLPSSASEIERNEQRPYFRLSIVPLARRNSDAVAIPTRLNDSRFLPRREHFAAAPKALRRTPAPRWKGRREPAATPAAMGHLCEDGEPSGWQ